MRIIYADFQNKLEKIVEKYATNGIFVIIDKNVYEIYFNSMFRSSKFYKSIEVYPVLPDESSKSIESVLSLWNWLIEKRANRHSLIINIGGGIVSDLGGFVASTFKRGIEFVNIPTTLLAMVDASIGGKTGVNFSGLKNAIGTFASPYMVLINTDFIKTLSPYTLLDGYSEMLKYGFISDKKLLSTTYQINLNAIDPKKIETIIKQDIQIKQRLAMVDKLDHNQRRALNFGHTFGHAFEAYLQNRKQPISHGTAVAWGMVCELYISVLKFNFPKDELAFLHTFVRDNYHRLPIKCDNYEDLYLLMTHDKKNNSKDINVTLLSNVGSFFVNQKASKDNIYEALEYVFG